MFYTLSCVSCIPLHQVNQPFWVLGIFEGGFTRARAGALASMVGGGRPKASHGQPCEAIPRLMINYATLFTM
jgi:hypothetical protein